jgi:hypothetical protein
MGIIRNKNMAGTILALAVVAALMVSYLPTPAAYASAPPDESQIRASMVPPTPPYADWPIVQSSKNAAAKEKNIGYGVKARLVNFIECSEKNSNVSYVKMDLKISGKAKKQGIYSLAIYYKGKKIKNRMDIYGNSISSNIRFGVVKGKVKASMKDMGMYVSSSKPIDFSKFQVKRVKFSRAYKVNVDKKNSKTKYNGMEVGMDIEAPSETDKKPVLYRPLNNKALYMVKRNAAVRFELYGDGGIRETALMTAEVQVGKKVVSGSAIACEGQDSTFFYFPSPIGAGSSSPFVYYASNWTTPSVRITKNTSVKIKSVTTKPFQFKITGTGVSSPPVNGISWKPYASKTPKYPYHPKGINSYPFYHDSKSSVIYNVDKGTAYYTVCADLDGTAESYPMQQSVRLAYSGDKSNLDFSKASTSFVVADRYSFKTGVAEDVFEKMYFDIPIRDITKPTTLDLSKLSYESSINSDIARIQCDQSVDVGEYDYEKDCNGMTWYMSLGTTPVLSDVYSNDSRLWGCVKKGETVRLAIERDGYAKKSGTVKYTLKIDGKAHKTWSMKVKKDKYYSSSRKNRRVVTLKANKDVTLSLTTKFIPAKKK